MTTQANCTNASKVQAFALVASDDAAAAHHPGKEPGSPCRATVPPISIE